MMGTANNVVAVKNALRQNMKKTLSLMSCAEKSLQSNYIADKLIHHGKYLMASRIGIYLSLPDEVETDAVLKHMFRHGKICFIPRYDSSSMKMVRMNSYEEKNTLPKTKWNISQPLDNDDREEALPSSLDLLVVPGRAFTKSGNRLGRGKGYYDKYLCSYCEKNDGEAAPYTIGLGFTQQLVDEHELPLTCNDVKLNEVIYA